MAKQSKHISEAQAEARVRKLIEESDGGFTLADFES